MNDFNFIQGYIRTERSILIYIILYLLNDSAVAYFNAIFKIHCPATMGKIRRSYYCAGLIGNINFFVYPRKVCNTNALAIFKKIEQCRCFRRSLHQGLTGNIRHDINFDVVVSFFPLIILTSISTGSNVIYGEQIKQSVTILSANFLNAE